MTPFKAAFVFSVAMANIVLVQSSSANSTASPQPTRTQLSSNSSTPPFNSSSPPSNSSSPPPQSPSASTPLLPRSSTPPPSSPKTLSPHSSQPTPSASEALPSPSSQPTPSASEALPPPSSQPTPSASEALPSPSSQPTPSASEALPPPSSHPRPSASEALPPPSSQPTPSASEALPSPSSQPTPSASEALPPPSSQPRPSASEALPPPSSQPRPSASEALPPPSSQPRPSTSEALPPPSSQPTPSTPKALLPPSASTPPPPSSASKPPPPSSASTPPPPPSQKSMPTSTSVSQAQSSTPTPTTSPRPSTTTEDVKPTSTSSSGSSAVDGTWANWGNWRCSVGCGSGTQSRNRTCTNPAPSGGGKECEGDSTEKGEACNNKPCAETKVSVTVPITSMVWDEKLKDTNSPEYQGVKANIESWGNETFGESETHNATYQGITNLTLTQGSVIAYFEALFLALVSSSEPPNYEDVIKTAINTGKIGNLTIDPSRLKIQANVEGVRFSDWATDRSHCADSCCFSLPSTVYQNRTCESLTSSCWGIGPIAKKIDCGNSECTQDDCNSGITVQISAITMMLCLLASLRCFQ